MKRKGKNGPLWQYYGQVLDENRNVSKKRKLVIGCKRIPVLMTDGCYHFKLRTGNNDSVIHFGYCQSQYSDSERDKNIQISAGVGEIYEVIYDIENEIMSIKQGNQVKGMLRNLPINVYPFIKAHNGREVKLVEQWKLPFVIQRYRLTSIEKEKETGISIIDKIEDELYKNKINNSVNDRIEYVVCNKVFEGGENSDVSYILEQMKDGISHYYYEIIKLGAGISFGYCPNPDLSNDNFPYIELSNVSSQKIKKGSRTESINGISGRVGEIYEVIYNMNEKIMSIKQGNNEIIEVFKQLPERIYPYIIAGNENGKIKLVEYYHERESYNLFDNIELCNFEEKVENDKAGEIVIDRIKVPNTIYGIYNYKKYVLIDHLSNLLQNYSQQDKT